MVEEVVKEEAVKEPDQFPDEETTATEETEEQGKWVVANCYPDGLKIIAAGFRLMADADAWVRENLEEGQVLIPLRLGVPRKLEVQRRVVEADL